MADKIIEAIWDSTAAELESLLVEKGNPDASEAGSSALLWACTINDPEKVKLLLRYGADVNLADEDGETPLMRAASTGDVESVAALLKMNANPNAVNDIGQTALMLASKEGKLEIVKLYVEYNVDVLAVDDLGRTALNWALTDSDHAEVVSYLVTMGLDPFQKNKNGMTPLDYADQLNREECLKIMKDGNNG